MDFVEKFVTQLRERSQDALYKDSAEAKVAARIADELEAHRSAYLSAELPMAEAVQESGYTDVQLRKLKKEGKWSGRRVDLPRRPRPVPLHRVGDGLTLAERVIARATSTRGRH